MKTPQELMIVNELKQSLRPLSRLALGLSLGLAFSACAAGDISGGHPGSGNGGTNGSGSNTGSGGTASTNPGAGGNVISSPTSPPSLTWYDDLKAADCSAAPTAFPATRIWRLSATQWKNTVTAALGVTAPDVTSFPGDTVDPITGFSDDSTDNKVTFPLASSYWDAADAAASAAAPGALTAFPCLATAPIATTCGQTFAAAYGQKMFRRALSAAETSSYATYLNSESKLDPAQTAVTSILKAMMLSPNFIYRTELGNSKPGTVDLTGDEIASMLSYTIADMPPDATLQAAAAAGQLSDPAQRETQAIRLTGLPGAKAKLASFWQEYLALGQQPTSPGMSLSMFNEAMTFFTNVVWSANGTFKDLMTAPYTYTTDTTLAAVYGSAKPDSTGKLTLDPTQRAGFLTSASMLGQTSAPSQAATVIHRGLLVRERILCETPPPPPAGFVPNPAQIQLAGDNATARENYDLFKMTMTGCNACHQAFQPIGLSFEAYDANGKFRTQYPAPISKPIDTTVTLTGAGDANGDYQGVVDMANKLGGSQIAQYCFTQQFASFAFGRGVGFDQESCTIRSMGDYVTSKGGGITNLFASLANAPAYKRIHQ
ncbi:MAG TPA: DUF1588 domain-containing protein [Polyangia bacterium]|nr:DUF1588 domain-containing protein [Polyangia bacterium]